MPKTFVDHLPLGLLWSLFPIVMWIAFLVLPSGAKSPKSRADKIIIILFGVLILGCAGYEIYNHLTTHRLPG